MRGQTHFGSAVVFIVLSSCIVLLSGMYALDDSSEPLSNLYLDSSFDETSLNAGAPDPLTIASDLNPSTSDDSRGMLDPYYTDSSDDLLLQSPESDLLLSSNAACSFDSSFLDENLGGAGADLELFGKREAPHQACKTSQEGSKKSGNNPEDILNNLPIFQPPHFSDFIEDMHVCNPYLVGDRDIPVCWFGAPHLPVKSDDMRMPGTLVGCSACMSCSFFSSWWFLHPGKLTAFSIQMTVILFRVARQPPYFCVVVLLTWTMTW